MWEVDLSDCQMSKAKKVEQIQNQSLRFVYGDYTSTYIELLDKAERALMYTSRLMRIVSLVEKCLEVMFI